ncbi:hypothetical protein IWX50DRAFT_634168 [Phyllosticta citricarpa]
MHACLLHAVYVCMHLGRVQSMRIVFVENLTTQVSDWTPCRRRIQFKRRRRKKRPLNLASPMSVGFSPSRSRRRSRSSSVSCGKISANERASERANARGKSKKKG